MIKREAIEDALIKMGVKVGNKGFGYLCDAVTRVEELQGDKHSIVITKDIYPYIAKKHNATDSRVERAIRHALNSTRDNQNSNKELIDKYMGLNNTNFNSIMQLFLMLKREAEE